MNVADSVHNSINVGQIVTLDAGMLKLYRVMLKYSIKITIQRLGDTRLNNCREQEQGKKQNKGTHLRRIRHDWFCNVSADRCKCPAEEKRIRKRVILQSHQQKIKGGHVPLIFIAILKKRGHFIARVTSSLFTVQIPSAHFL